MRFLFSIVAIFTILAVPLAHAGERDGSKGDAGASNTINNRTTDALLRQLSNDTRACMQLFEAYRYDCHRKTYRFAANRIKGSIDYLPAYEALKLVEQRISAAVEANLDPDAGRIRKGLQRYSAVKPAALPRIEKETIRALEDAKTILLRSPAPHQKPHFQRIAAVIDSHKVLIRSALLRPHMTLFRLAQALSGGRFG
ncbi:MAG: hypothetical protein BM562_03795 [Alphaproteobacteria bacterium MedPE-SWcel]|nr:MAG: hypothetical protein BM562_03795 [Alphaproteobacteria bacterium MedPE-SWcel]